MAGVRKALGKVAIAALREFATTAAINLACRLVPPPPEKKSSGDEKEK